MQDRYAGDAGDFSKLGLLRALAPRRAGIVWYRVPNEAHNGDGKHVRYLEHPERFRAFDPELFDALRDVARAEPRTTASILPRVAPSWVSFDERVPQGDARAAWVERAAAAVAGCDVVCLDPDNGLLPASVRAGSRLACKYATDAEVARLAGDATLVVYQHLHRAAPADVQAARFRDRLAAATGRPAQVVRYHRGTSRLYGVCAAPGVAIADRLQALVARWAGDFSAASPTERV